MGDESGSVSEQRKSAVRLYQTPFTSRRCRPFLEIQSLLAALCSLNAWCELSIEDLRGRCPRSRVGLLPHPEGKGTDPSCSTWTPSSPHFTLWSTTSATPIRQHLRSRARKPPCVQAK